MKYIGNKTKVLDFIESTLLDAGINYHKKNVIDLFAGTGSVSNFFLKNECNVISCDNMTYSIAEQYRVNYFNEYPEFDELKAIVGDRKIDSVLEYLNKIKPIKGYFYENYAPGGREGRQYFSDNNAMKLDAIRSQIEEWKDKLPYDKYMYLLGILMCSADRVSNTSGTYGAYLKIWRSMALKDLVLEKPEITSKGKNKIQMDDVINCVKQFKNNDIIYLDPPYNGRQYASNFHVLESIVVFDKQKLKGKTGLREYEHQKSDFCLKTKVKNALDNLIKNCDSKYIIMSYSTEGLMSEQDILDVMLKYGNTKVYKNDYRRFKTNSWTDNNTNLQELLFVCEVHKKKSA